MDWTFVEGAGAVLSGIIVFLGSVFLLMALVMGARLAYFISACVTLGFLVMMGVVWSFSPLGPVGQLPEWDGVAVEENASSIDFGPAAEYPEGPWKVAKTDEEKTQAGEIGTSAQGYIGDLIDKEKEAPFENEADGVADADLTRILEQDGDTYGMTTLEPVADAEGGPAVVLLRYDQGNPNGPARVLTLGFVILFVLHLIGLSFSEKRARRVLEAEGRVAQ